MKNLLKPAVTLMNRLSFPHKMGLVVIVFSLPLITFLYLLISEINVVIELSKKEILGSTYNSTMTGLLQDLQQHRGMVNAFLRGDESFRDKIDEKQSQIKIEIEIVDEMDRRFGASLQTSERWIAIKNRWQAIKNALKQSRAEEIFESHTGLSQDILDMMIHVSDVSNLLLDSDISIYYLTETMFSSLPLTAEYAGQIRGRGAGAIVSGTIDPQEKAHLIVLSGLLKSSLKKVEKNLHKVYRENPSLREEVDNYLGNALTAGYESLEMLNNHVVFTDRISIEPVEFFDTFTRTVNKYFELNSLIADSLDDLLDTRITYSERKRLFIITGSLLTLLIIVYLSAGHYFSVMNALTGLVQASRRIGRGEFNGHMTVETKDEMAEVTQSFIEMSRSLKEFTGQLKKTNEALEREVGARKHTEEILMESKRSLSTLMSNLPGMAYRCLNDHDWTMKFVSGGAYDLTGYKYLELVENRDISYADLINPRDRDAVWRDVQDALDRKGPFKLVYRIRHRSGKEKWVWEQGRGVYTPEGELLALEGFIADITERIQALEALRESETRYRVITETASDAILTIDDNSMIIMANPAIEKVLGYTTGEIIGQNITTLMPERHRNSHLHAMERYLETGKSSINWKGMELQGLHKNGEEIPLEISYGEFVLRGRHFFSGIIRDISDRKQAEKEKIYKHMLERFNQGLETLVSERTMSLISLKLADRIRTPAAVIGWTGNKLLKRGDVPEKYTRGLMSIVEEADSLEATVKEFESVLISKQPVFHYEDVNDIIRSTLFIIDKEAADKGAELSVNLSEEPLKINAQKDLLRMALFNLLRNAVESTPEGGRITVHTSGDIDEVYITISNTGTGIPAEFIDRIFELENGMKVYKYGMSLPLIKQIVSEHLGEIEVESEAGKGAIFRITIPARWMKKA
jgi:PAS domain S-box-containing protein